MAVCSPKTYHGDMRAMWNKTAQRHLNDEIEILEILPTHPLDPLAYRIRWICWSAWSNGLGLTSHEKRTYIIIRRPDLKATHAISTWISLLCELIQIIS